MASGISPYRYHPGRTPLHRAPGGLKLLGLLVLSGGVFFSGPLFLGLTSLLVVLGALSAGLNPGELLRGSRPLIIMLILTGAPRCLAYPPFAFNRAGLGEALLFSWGILVSFAAGALLFSVTTMGELRDSLAAAGGFLRARVAPHSRKKGPGLSLAISLMLGFLPRFFEIWETANDAYRARGGKRGPSGIFVVMPRVIEGMLLKAGETAQALEGRTPRW